MSGPIPRWTVDEDGDLYYLWGDVDVYPDINIADDAYEALVQAVRDADTLAKVRNLIQARATSGLLDGLTQDLLDLLTKDGGP